MFVVLLAVRREPGRRLEGDAGTTPRLRRLRRAGDAERDRLVSNDAAEGDLALALS
jgi:hypothetical protein